MSQEDAGPEPGAAEAPTRRRYRSGDIDVIVPEGILPVSRGAAERKLERINRYDRRAELTRWEALTPTGTVALHFRVVDDEPFEFLPGQFVGIQAYVEGWGLRKSPYCITSPPDGDRTFRLIVRLVPDGPLSRYLGALKPGDVIQFRGPMGRSMVPKEDDTELILMATGVGVGPFISLAEYLLGQGFDRRIRLFWGLRLHEDICLLDELDDLARRYDLFSYRITLSQPPPTWTGLRGRVTESAPRLIDAVDGKHFYLVGNGAMIDEVTGALTELGLTRKLIYEERYFGTKQKPDPAVVERIREGFVARDLTTLEEVQQAVEDIVFKWQEGRAAGGGS